MACNRIPTLKPPSRTAFVIHHACPVFRRPGKAADGGDYIFAAEGADVVLGGGGKDWIDGGDDAGADIILGDNGVADFTDGVLIKIVSSGPGDDDQILPGDGDDVVFGGVVEARAVAHTVSQWVLEVPLPKLADPVSTFQQVGKSIRIV